MSKYSVPNRKRTRVFQRDGGQCFYCGCELHLDTTIWQGNRGKNPERDAYCCIDHLHAEHLGGIHDDINLVACCRPCNTRKGTKSLDEYRAYMAARLPHRVAATLIQQALNVSSSPLDASLIAAMQWHEEQIQPYVFPGELRLKARELQ